MHFTPDWRRVLRHAWSPRLLALALVAAVLTGVETALPYLQDVIFLPSLVWAGVTVVLVAAAFLARFIFQEEFK